EIKSKENRANERSATSHSSRSFGPGRVTQAHHLRRGLNCLLWFRRRTRRRWWWTLTLKLLAFGGKLCFLLGRQHARDLRHHLRVGNLQFHLDLGPRFRRGAHRRFVEGSARGVGFAAVQGAHLIEERFVALFKAVSDLLDLGLLIFG